MVSLVNFVRKKQPEIQYPRARIRKRQWKAFAQTLDLLASEMEAGHFYPRSGIRYPVDYGRLCSVRQSLADQVSRTKKAALGAVGCRFNPASEEEVSAVLRIDPVLAKVIGFRKIS